MFRVFKALFSSVLVTRGYFSVCSLFCRIEACSIALIDLLLELKLSGIVPAFFSAS